MPSKITLKEVLLVSDSTQIVISYLPLQVNYRYHIQHKCSFLRNRQHHMQLSDNVK